MSSLSALSYHPTNRADHRNPRRMGHRNTAALMASALIFVAAPAEAAEVDSERERRVTTSAPPSAEQPTAQQAADLGPANATTHDVQQSVAIIDRATGELVAGYDGDRVFETESILKMFTAAFYLLRADGAPDADLTGQLRTMIELSDNGIQSSLWRADIVPTIADRYGLTNTRNGPRTSAGNWGSDRTTANDQASFLQRMSQDRLVAPHLMAWMASAAPTGSDDFNQAFGFNALTGDHGSKQGWTDPGRSPVNLHSVGWTGRYFAAILQNSDTATYATMRETSTHTARLIAAAGEPSAADTAGVPADSEPTVDPAPVPADSTTTASEPAASEPAASEPAAAASDQPPATSVAPSATSNAATNGWGSPPAVAETTPVAEPSPNAAGGSNAQLDGSAILAGWLAAASAPEGPVESARSLAHTIAWSDPVKNLAIGRLFARMLFADARC